MEDFDEFDEWLVIRQSYSYKPSYLLYKPQEIRQSFVNSSFVEVFPCQTNFKFVTGFAKTLHIHTSNFMTLVTHNLLKIPS